MRLVIRMLRGKWPDADRAKAQACLFMAPVLTLPLGEAP
jgi:hypothetical protein